MVKETCPQSHTNLFDESNKPKSILSFDKQNLQSEESFIFEVSINNQPRAEIQQQTQPYISSKNLSSSSRFETKEEDSDLDQYFSFPCSYHEIKTAASSSQFENALATQNNISSNLNCFQNDFPANSKPHLIGEHAKYSCATQQELFELNREASFVDEKNLSLENDIMNPASTLRKSISLKNYLPEEKNTLDNQQQLSMNLIILQSKKSNRISRAMNKLQAKKSQVDASASNQNEEENRMFEEKNENTQKPKKKQSDGFNQMKQNIYKSIMNAFRGFVAQKNEIKLLFSKLTSDENTNIDNQIKQLKRYLKTRSFNYHILKYLMNHKIYCIIFKHFMIFESTNWLEKSKVENKEQAIQEIDLLKRCIEDRELLDNFTCYRRRRKNNEIDKGNTAKQMN